MSHLWITLRVVVGLVVALFSLLALGVSMYLPLAADFRFLSWALVPIALGLAVGAALFWVSWRLIVPPLRQPNA